MLTKDEIFDIIRTTNKKEILKTYTKKDLAIMYTIIYNGVSPISSLNKSDILNGIFDYYRTMIRTKALIDLN